MNLKINDRWIKKIAYLLLLGSFIGSLFIALNSKNKNFGGVIWSDAEGYYMYLPALFIYHGFENLPIKTTSEFKHYEDTNKYFTKYTCGVAIMQTPFFLAFHWHATQYGKPTTGYSNPYTFSVLFSAVFYAYLGMLFLFWSLNRQFHPFISLLTVLVFYWGTNLYYYTVFAGGMSHAYSFCLFSLVLYFAPRFYKKPGWGMFALMGFLSGLIVLIRPTNILILLFLFLYDVNSWEGLKERFLFYWKNLSRFWVFPLASFLVFVPQFLYWHYISGEFVLYSYGNQGFPYWKNPQIVNVLFHIKGGWLIFTPLMYLTLIGLFVGAWQKERHVRAILLVILLALYAFSSWWSWWFGGAFGYRSLVEFYALLAFPFAFLIRKVFQLKWISPKVAFLTLLYPMIYYNIQLSIDYDSLYRAHYDWDRWEDAIEEYFPTF